MINMSNPFKDWYEDMSEKQKKIYNICMEYPFLIPRDINGNRDEDFEYEYLSLEIPDGWRKLFLQMCRDIKPFLVREGLLDDFYFIQVKEKYNFMRCYYTKTPWEVDQITSKYEHMAHYICTVCGRPATCETQDYLASFCDDCWKDYMRHEHIEWIEFKPYFKVSTLTEGTHFDEKIISFKDEWDRYIKENGYDTV